MQELKEDELNNIAGESGPNFGTGESILLATAGVVLLAPEAVPIVALGALAFGASAVASALFGWI